MNKDFYAVIMAGGIGSRFWPMSTVDHPKQFMDILGSGRTLIQQTYDRFLNVCPKENIFVVTNERYKNMVLSQLDGMQENQVLCEPVMRNTAPAIAYAAFKIYKQNPDAKMTVAPSDHIILKEEKFQQIVLSALQIAEQNKGLLTLGIKPTRPDTGYGYIQFDENSSSPEQTLLRKVKRFTEKPDLQNAEKFLASGDFVWNAGIFVWSAESILNAFKMFIPDLYAIFDSGRKFLNTTEEETFINAEFPKCPNISIDYGVMEKATNVFTMISDIGWSDLGTWGSLFDISPKDENNNALVNGNIITYDSCDNMIHVPAGRQIVVQGLHDFIIVENDNTILICAKKDEQKIKNIVQNLKT
jgi:mannose-1-phosphate guanylyltransferase